MGIPYCIVKGKARLGRLVHRKTCTCVALTNVSYFFVIGFPIPILLFLYDDHFYHCMIIIDYKNMHYHLIKIFEQVRMEFADFENFNF